MRTPTRTTLKPSGQVGSTVILEGNAFGDLRASGQALFSDGAGGTIAATVASEADWTNTFIVTTVPSGAKTGDIKVTTATGASNALTFTVTEAAVFSPSTINWKPTTDLPTAVSGHRARFVPIDDAGGVTVPYVHVTGGASDDNAPRTDVVWAQIQDTTVASWNSGTALLEGRAFHTMAVATPFTSRVKGSGHLYVLGGIAADGGQPVTTVYRAPLNMDGTVGSWATTTALPLPLHSAGAVVFRSFLYLAGGSTTDNAPVASVYRAAIDSLGELGAWEQLPALPAGRTYHALVTFGGFLYAVAGESAVVTPNDASTAGETRYRNVVYVKINLRTGLLDATSWTLNPGELSKHTSKHTAIIAGGSIFVTGGLYSGAAGSTENSFAQINADGSTGNFQGATGANTISSQAGYDPFNHAAITFFDLNGKANVMVLGGDDLSNPGTRSKNVMVYRIQ